MSGVNDGQNRLRVLLVGYGRMGRSVESASEIHNCDVVGRIDVDTASSALAPGQRTEADVAIDFSTPTAFVDNFPKLAALGLNVVVGTTGWQDEEPRLRDIAERSGIGVVAAPNFSLGVAFFQSIAVHAARLFAAHPAFGLWLHESHHAAKRDAPSGTALAIKAAISAAGYPHSIDIASTRAGHVPGIHTVGFDGPSETLTLSHSTRDRATFAHGALEAATWVNGRRGWFNLSDVLGLPGGVPAPAGTRSGGRA